MDNLIYENAYGILGLLPNSTQKEISKRIKEIEKLIQIEEMPCYAYEFSHYNKIRTLQKIKDAQQNISVSKLQLLHYFFRIYVSSEKETNLIKKFDEQFNYENILEYYNHTAKKSFNLKKNVAIILSLFLLTNKETKDIEPIVDFNITLWREIIENNKSFKDFQKIYLLDDEIGIDEKLFEDLSDNILEELTNIFSDIAKYHENNEILSKFIEKFNLEDKTFNIAQVENIYKKIDNEIQTLKSLNISEDGIFDDNEKALLKQCLQTFQDEFNKLIDLNLYEHEKTIILRDLVATTIRIQILDLFNNLQEDEVALNLMKFAIYISGTGGLKTKLNDELSCISSNVESMKLLDPIHKQIDKIEKNIKYISMFELKEILQLITNLLDELSVETTLPLNEQAELFDVVAIRLKALAVKMHNNHEKFKESQILINLALSSAKSQKIKNLCLKDLATINRTVDEKCGFCNSPLGQCILFPFVLVFSFIKGIFPALLLYGIIAGFIYQPIITIIIIIALVIFIVIGNKNDKK